MLFYESWKHKHWGPRACTHTAPPSTNWRTSGLSNNNITITFACCNIPCGGRLTAPQAWASISAVRAHSYQRSVPLLVRWNQRGLMSRCRTNTVLSWQVAPNYINKPDYSGTLTVYTRFKRIIWVHRREKDEGSACVFESKVRNDCGAQRREQR